MKHGRDKMKSGTDVFNAVMLVRIDVLVNIKQNQTRHPGDFSYLHERKKRETVPWDRL